MTELLIDLSTYNEKQIDKAWQLAAGVRKRKEQYPRSGKPRFSEVSLIKTGSFS